MYLTYIFLILAVAFGTASNIFAKEAEGFSKIIPSPKFVFRFSENTFVLMLMNKQQKEVKQLESKLKQIFEYNPLHVNGKVMQSSIQWGLSVYPNEAKDLFSLISLSRNRLSSKIEEKV